MHFLVVLEERMRYVWVETTQSFSKHSTCIRMLYRPSVDEGGPLLAPFGFPHVHVCIRILVCLLDGEASHEASDHRNVPREGSGLCAPHVDLR